LRATAGHELFELLGFLSALLGTRRAEKGGSTRVLVWNGFLWYRSAIVMEEVSVQYGGCVGKVRVGNLSVVVLSL